MLNYSCCAVSGNIILRKKGCVDWLKRLQQLETHLIELSTMQEKQLEEQRTTYMVSSAVL